VEKRNSDFGNAFEKNFDSVERFIRFLISNNELSLARNILEALGKKYNHLLFELEVKAGNYARAVEIFNFMPREQQELYIHVVESIEKDVSKVSEALERILKEFNEENYPIVIAEIQKIKKEFPQVIEIIAMELLTALKRGDKKKIQLLSEILSQLDRTHPVLTQVKKQKSFGTFLFPALTLVIFIVVLVNLVVSFMNFTKSGALQLGKLEKSISNLQGKIEGYTNDITKKYEELSRNLEVVKTSLDYINKKLENPTQASNDSLPKALSDQLSLVNEKLSDVERQISQLAKNLNKRVSIGNPGSQTTIAEYGDTALKELSTQIRALKERIVSLEGKLESMKATSSAKTTSLSSSDDFGKIYSELSIVKTRLGRIEESVMEIAKAKLDESMKNIMAKLTEISAQINQLRFSSTTSSKSTNGELNSSSMLDLIQKQLETLSQSIGILYSEMLQIKEQRGSTNEQSRQDSGDFTEKILEFEQKFDKLLLIVEQLSKEISGRETVNKSEEQGVVGDDRVQELERKIDNVLASLKELTNEVTIQRKEFESKVSNLKEETTSVKTNLDDLSKQIVDLKKELEALKSNVSKILEILSSTQKGSDSSALNDDKTPVASTGLSNSEKTTKTFEQVSVTSFVLTYASTSSTSQNQEVVEQKTVNLAQQNEVVEQILKQTKDLRELFLIGLRFYVEGQYGNAIAIFSYIEPRIEDLDIYFKEDMYYYEILSYIGLGQREQATKKYETYKKLYPSGQYIKELSAYFK
jgi:tetratricopeptide (TPR) repeat protein